MIYDGYITLKTFDKFFYGISISEQSCRSLLDSARE